MIGTVGRYQVQSDKVDEAIEVAKKAVTPLEEHPPQGYRGFLNLFDRNSGTFVSIHLWDTAADEAAFASSPLRRELVGPLLPLLIGQPVSETFEVAVKA